MTGGGLTGPVGLFGLFGFLSLNPSIQPTAIAVTQRIEIHEINNIFIDFFSFFIILFSLYL
jgi:hypothetical protein